MPEDRAKLVAAECYRAFIDTAVPPFGGGLSDKQFSLMKFLQGFIDDNGWSPSLQEVADGMGLDHKSRARERINTLEKRGWVSREETSPRSIEILRRV